MQLVEPTYDHFVEMLTWISSQAQLHEWAGPNVTYPCTAHTLMIDFKVSTLLSFALVDNQNNLMAFGQCYERVKHCHLGRLIVAPEFRGKGLVAKLIDLLSIVGCREFNTDVCSLFVLKANNAAIKAYQRIGFELSDYPFEIPLDSCLYMTKPSIVI